METANTLLLSHSHHELNSWIDKKEKMGLDRSCLRFFCILHDFYHNYRYNRYADSIEEGEQINEFDLIKGADDGYTGEDYDLHLKKYLGKLLGTISYTYYMLIKDICYNINIYAYEIDVCSTAAIVFCNSKAPNLFIELQNRQNEKKELIYWLLKESDKYSRLQYFSTEALDFDPGMVDCYISDMIYRPDMCEELHDAVDSIYDEMCSQDKENWKKHIEEVRTIIANPNILEE